MLVSDVLLFGVMQWIIVRDVSLDAAVFLLRWTIDCQELLGRLEDGSLVLRSARTLLVISAFLSSAESYLTS